MPSRASRGKNSSEPNARGMRVAARIGMTLDREQAEILREILHTALTQLRFESARADSRAFREKLHHREQVVETLLAAPDLAERRQ